MGEIQGLGLEKSLGQDDKGQRRKQQNEGKERAVLVAD